MVDLFRYRVASATNHLGRPPVLVDSARLGEVGARFASLYAVRREDAQAISRAAGTAFGFRGVVWSRRLWIDFDDERAAEGAREKLKREGLDHVAYHTGNRGIHLGVLRAAEPSHVLPWQDKRWVGEQFPEADMSLYWHLHLVRLPGALHEKTGRPKVLVEKVPGRELVLPPFSEPEERPRTIGAPSVPRGSLFSDWGVGELLTPEPGCGRHEHVVKLAVALRDAKASFDEAVWVSLEVNRGFLEPKEESEVVRVVKWAFGVEG